MSKTRIACGVLSALVLLTAALSGCGGDSFEIKVAKPANERPDFSDDIAAKGPLHMPSPTPFNLVSPSLRENGICDAQCGADPSGKAAASVEASDGGSGWAEFQVGYTFDLTGKQPIAAVVEVTVDMTQVIEVSSLDLANTAKVNVILMVKDSNGTTLHSDTLLANNSESGARSWAARPTIAFDVKFAPDFGYYVVVAARIEAASAAGQKASARLEMKQCEMTISWKKDAPLSDACPAAPPAVALR